MITQKDGLLIVGVDSFVGSALADRWREKWVIGTTRYMNTLSINRIFLDLSEDISMWQPPEQITVAVICAAATSFAQCRQEPIITTFINVTNTVELAKKLLDKGIFTVFLSTSAVYNGTSPFCMADEVVSPTTEYGRQKAKAEEYLLELGDLVSVVRLTKVISGDIPLITGWRKKLNNQEVINPFTDMVMSPISLGFTINVLNQVIKTRLSGIVQVSGDQDVSYAHVIQHIAHKLGLKQDLVRPIHSRESGVSFESVPVHTTLDMTTAQTSLGLSYPSVWETINTVFDL